MKIALLLNPKKQHKPANNLEQAVVFEIEENKVIGVENESLESKDYNYLSVWARTKKIKEMYIPDIDEQAKALFKKIGITIRKYEELNDDRLFRTFII